MGKKETGNFGERIALSLLRSCGYKILAKNFHTKFGEIDIVAKDKDTLVFVEVKTRHGKTFGLPEEAVGNRKLKRMEKAAQIYKTTRSNLPEGERIDVVSIELSPDGEVLRKEIIKNAS